MSIGSSGVVNCANTYLGTANYTVADGYVADRTPIVGGNGPAQLNLNFARNEVLDPRVTFSRTSNATRVNAQGLIEYAPHNLLTYSEQFDNAVWVKADGTIAANSVVAPDGTTTADVYTVGTSSSVPSQNTTIVEGNTYCISIHFHSLSTAPFIRIRVQTATGSTSAFINTATKTFGTVLAQLSNAIVTDVGNGWYRASVNYTPNAGDGGTRSIAFAGVITNNSSTAATGTTLVYWGAQLNIGSLQPYYTTSVKNLLGYTQNFENAAWTKSNSSVLTNLLTYSQEFDNASWSKTNTTVTANTVVAPDGTTTADKITYTATSANITQTASSTTATYTISTYVKSSNTSFCRIRVAASTGGSGTVFSSFFNISAGTIAAAGVATADFGSITHNISVAANGWYRISVTFTVLSAATSIQYGIIAAQSSGGSSAAGDELYIWGAQLVQGTNPEEYTVTTSAPAPIQVMGPLGFLGAEKLVESAVNGSHTLGQGVPTIIGLPTTYSFYAKAGERSKITFAGGGYTAQGFASIFNLATGTLDLNTGGKASITSVGSGWYRCAISFTPSTTGGLSTFILDDSGNSVYTGDGTSGIYIFGAQLSDSASLDPYVYNFGAAPTSSAYYGPRFDYDPVTLAPKGLLIEEQRTNLLTYSSEFDNVLWSKAAVAITANQRISPDGTLSMDTITLTGGAGYLQQTATTTSTVAYNLSIFVYAASNKTRIIAHNGATDICAVTWSSISANTNTVSGIAANVTSTLVGNNIYRLSFSFIASSTTTNIRLQCLDSGGNPAIGTIGDFWGAQLEVGAFPASYIPTTSAQVTRTADNASMVGTNFSSWYNQSEGTVVCSSDSPQTLTTAEINWYLTNNAVTDTIFNRKNTSNTIASAVVVNSVAQGDIVSGTTISSNVTAQSAFSYKLNDLAISVNGAAVGTDSLANIPFVEKLYLGANPGAGQVLNGHIQSFKFFSKRFINTYLQSLTQ